MSTAAYPDSELPLSESTFYILLSLAEGPRHGYAIMKDVADLSDNRLSLGTGTLYGALSRMQERGWITRSDVAPAESETGRPRKDYALTDLGRRILTAETDRLQTLVASANLRLAGGKAQ